MLSKKIEFLRRWGLVRSLYALLLRVCRKFLTFSITAVVYRPLVRMNSSTSSPEGYHLGILSEQELLDFCHDPTLQLDATGIKGLFARGEICVGAALDGKLVAYHWCAFSATPDNRKKNIWVDFNAEASYGHWGFTLPAHRGKHILSSLLAIGDNYCLDKDKTSCIAFVDTDNYPSLRACMRAGSRIVGYAGYIYLFGKLFSFRTPGAKEHGFRIFTPRSPAVDKLKARISWRGFSLLTTKKGL